MIKQVVDCAKGHGQPPPELEMSWRCEQYHALPEAGGVYDQDYFLLMKMRAYSNVYNVVSRFITLKGDKIHTLSNSERKIIGALREERFI